MKKLLFIIPLGLSVLAIGCTTNTDTNTTEATVEQQEASIIDVNVNDFEESMHVEAGQVLDVRTPEEWAGGTIKGAIKMNFYDADFAEQINKLDKNKPIYVYCKAGGRSAKAADQLNKAGFKNVFNLLGGITAWNSAGKETVK